LWTNYRSKCHEGWMINGQKTFFHSTLVPYLNHNWLVLIIIFTF
jgi:hypothetical protein